MNPRVTLLVVAAFLALLGYVMFVDSDKPAVQLNATPTKTSVAKPYIFPVSPSDIKAMQVRDLRAAREVKLANSDAGWQVEKPEAKTGDDFKITQMLNRVITLQSTRVITTANDLKPFGFAPAQFEARITMKDGTEYGILIGDKTPGGNDYYAVHTGSSLVFTLATSLIDDLMLWFDAPPYQPTPTPTFTPTPAVTPTPSATPTP
ncbi:MAG: DUF4340 domain-containing protein [Chloroflexi bacterium]|nr:DUF4340 domain-containing protein [Chloroflexota bacterium]